MREWIEAVTGTAIPEGPENVYKELKSGVILCKYVQSQLLSRNYIVLKATD